MQKSGFMKKKKQRRKKAVTTLVTDGKRTGEREGGNVLEYGKKVIRMNKRREKTRALCGHVILSLTNIFSHILPTADEPQVSAAFVFPWVTAETQRSREKAKRATQTVQHRQGNHAAFTQNC